MRDESARVRSVAGRGRRGLPVVGGLLAVAVLSASTCDGNLGDNRPRPVTFRVSAGANGVVADGGSTFPRGSADGRFVVFSSDATNLAFPASDFKEIYVKDRRDESIENITKLGDLASSNPAAFLADCDRPNISADGRYVVFESAAELAGGLVSTQTTTNVFWHDRLTGTTRAVVAAVWPDVDCQEATVSADGMLVAFQSRASNLPGFANGGRQMIYVADMSTSPVATLTLVSHADGAPGTASNGNSSLPKISDDGQFVAYISTSSDLTTPATNGMFQVVIGSTAAGGNELVSRASGAAGAESDVDCVTPVDVSGDGRYVVFGAQNATTLVPGAVGNVVYVRDRNVAAPLTTAVADNGYVFAGIFDELGVSDDGQVVMYRADDEQIHVRNGTGGGDRIASVGPSGAPGNNPLGFHFPSLTADGRWVFWFSRADNLVLGDTNLQTDAFGHGPLR